MARVHAVNVALGVLLSVLPSCTAFVPLDHDPAIVMKANGPALWDYDLHIVKATSPPGDFYNPSAAIDGVIDNGQWRWRGAAGYALDCSDVEYVILDLGELTEVSAVQYFMYNADVRSYCSQSVTLSTSGEFLGEESSIFECDTYEVCGRSLPEGRTVRLSAPKTARYVRLGSSRNNLNGGVHILEAKVRGFGLATDQCSAGFAELQSIVGASSPSGGFYNPGGAIDGVIDNRQWRGGGAAGNANGGDCSDVKYVILDLGELTEVTAVQYFTYSGDERSYCSQSVAVSETGHFDGEETTAFQCDSFEQCGRSLPEGRVVSFAPKTAKYVRVGMSHSTHYVRGNFGVHLLEVKVYRCDPGRQYEGVYLLTNYESQNKRVYVNEEKRGLLAWQGNQWCLTELSNFANLQGSFNCAWSTASEDPTQGWQHYAAWTSQHVAVGLDTYQQGTDAGYNGVYHLSIHRHNNRPLFVNYEGWKIYGFYGDGWALDSFDNLRPIVDGALNLTLAADRYTTSLEVCLEWPTFDCGFSTERFVIVAPSDSENPTDIDNLVTGTYQVSGSHVGRARFLNSDKHASMLWSWDQNQPAGLDLTEYTGEWAIIQPFDWSSPPPASPSSDPVAPTWDPNLVLYRNWRFET